MTLYWKLGVKQWLPVLKVLVTLGVQIINKICVYVLVREDSMNDITECLKG